MSFLTGRTWLLVSTFCTWTPMPTPGRAWLRSSGALDHASGLGLWLVRRVVTQSGGELSFEVEDGTHVEIALQRVTDTE